MRKSWMILSVGLLVLILSLMAGCRRETEQVPLPPLVKTEGVQMGASVLELRGSVASEGRMKLGFKAPGILGSVQVREGEAVRQGQVLASLDEADARAQLLTSKAALERARRESERADRLVKEGALPAAQQQDARNQLEICEAQWAQAQDALRRTRILAPASGTVYQRLAEPGEAVPAGNPVLVVDTTGQLVVRAGVTEGELKRLRKDQAVQLLPEDGSPAFQGRLRNLGAAPGPDGLYPLEILPEASTRLRSGALLKVRLETSGCSGLRIPLPALVHRQNQDFVFVVEGSVARARKVRVEKAEGSGLCVREGLAKGELVVAEGAYFLQDGQAVRIQE